MTRLERMETEEDGAGIPSVVVGGRRPSLVSSNQRRHRLELYGLDRRQRMTHRALTLIWLIAVAGFAAWWFTSGHIVSVFRLTVSSTLLAWTVLMPGWFLFFVGRVAMVPSTLEPPPGRVAMVVTKAPSEPWFVVLRTLVGMLAQDHPHDTWLADECPDDETRRWCDANGVQLCSREGVEEYHQPSWPRRTRSKEGNLAYFYDMVGYDAYDFVVQLDADHVPERGYLEAMLRPFTDPAVGYVSAPSICDANTDRSWSARARAHAESGLHGALQAGSNRDFAPLCIGSHYGVRTEALRAVGGLGPELAEDHSTTLLMNAAGWRGIHAIDAIAHGDGPESFTDLMTQEFQWSRSLVKLLVSVTPRMLRHMPWRIRVQFLFSELWYPAYALVMLASVVLPIVALFTDTPWMRLSYPFFLAFGVAVSTIVFLIAAWIRRQGWYRPVDSPLFSWEAGLFHVLRWPWLLFGTIAAVGDSIRGTEFSFTVTPKGQTGAKPLPLVAIAPYLLIAAVSAAATVVIDDAGEARGYYWFTLANTVLYTAAAAAVVVLHRRENRAGRLVGATHRISAAALAVLVVLVVLVGMVGLGIAMRGDDIRGALTWTGQRELPPPAGSSKALVDAGIIDITTGSVNLGIYDFTGDFTESDRFAVGHHFVTWIDTDADQIAELVLPDIELGRWPMLTVEPEPLAGARDTLLADIAAGRYDAQTRAVCAGLAQAGSPAFVRWGHEMEGRTGRYAWATGQPGEFVAAFRRFEAGCREVLGDDLFMVWSPLGEAGLEEYWPGADVVDYVGLPVFDFPEYAEAVGGDPDATFDDVFAPRYERVAGFGKPVMVAEFGSTRVGADQVGWFDDAFASTPNYPLLRTIVFFQAPDTEGVWGDEVVTPTWRIDPTMLPNGGP